MISLVCLSVLARPPPETVEHTWSTPAGSRPPLLLPTRCDPGTAKWTSLEGLGLDLHLYASQDPGARAQQAHQHLVAHRFCGLPGHDMSLRLRRHHRSFFYHLSSAQLRSFGRVDLFMLLACRLSPIWSRVPWQNQESLLTNARWRPLLLFGGWTGSGLATLFFIL